MKPEEFEKYRKAFEDGSIPDDLNPLSLFSITATNLLVRGLAGEFSFTELAKYQLVNRGLNLKGEWVGYEKAKKEVFAPKRKRGKHL